MALNCAGSAGTQRVTSGPHATINNIAAGTYLLWFKPSSIPGLRRLVVKSNGRILAINDASGNFRGFVNRATTSTNYITNTNPAVSGEWNCVMMTWDLAAGAGELVNVYRGSLTAAMTECGYGSQTDGTGVAGDDSANPLSIAGDGTNSGLPGDYAIYAVFNRVLTRAEGVNWQFQPRMMSGCVDFKHLYGTGTQPDWSGTGNAGTVASMTEAAHVPLGPAFAADDYLDRYVAAAGPTFNPAWNASANTVYQPGVMAA